jgi:hypothetical protein
MARKATGKRGAAKGKATGAGTKKSSTKPRGTKVARATSSRSRSGGRSDQDAMGDAFIKLLQSPLVADLVAVAATAALAALAEHGFSSRGASGTGHRAGRAVKEAGKAAAAAVGRRLTTEVEEIRKATKSNRGAGG